MTKKEFEDWLRAELKKRKTPPTKTDENKIVDLILSSVRSESNIKAFMKGYNPEDTDE